MGRLLLLLLFIAAAVLLWKAFAPRSLGGAARPTAEPRQIKGPDDDEEFLWKLEKERFKQRRAEEERRKREEGGQQQ
ncbi:hypothetical protein QVA66_05270 [Staphylococcus chromogenes]|nr:hypothetical protein [Staphylococcus chromogenes]